MAMTIKDCIVVVGLLLVISAIPAISIYFILEFIPNKIIDTIIITIGTMFFAFYLSLGRGF